MWCFNVHLDLIFETTSYGRSRLTIFSFFYEKVRSAKFRQLTARVAQPSSWPEIASTTRTYWQNASTRYWRRHLRAKLRPLSAREADVPRCHVVRQWKNASRCQMREASCLSVMTCVKDVRLITWGASYLTKLAAKVSKELLRYWGTSYLKHQFVNKSVLHSFTHFFFNCSSLSFMRATFCYV